MSGFSMLKKSVGDHPSLTPANPFAAVANPFAPSSNLQSVPAHNMLSESPDPFAGLAAPAVPQYVMAPRHNVDPKADHLASGHYAEDEHEGSAMPERMHQVGDGAIQIAEHLGVHGLGALDTFMGPLGAMFGYNELKEGAETGDSYKVMSGGTSLIGAGGATVEMLGSLISGVTGTAVEAGAVAGVAPVAGSLGAGLALGHAGDVLTDSDTKAHGYYGDMSSKEHRIAEGEKIDGNREHSIGGAIRAVETAYTDMGVSATNNGIGGGGFVGVADAIVAKQRAAEKAQMERSFYDDMPVSEETSIRSSSR